VKRRSIRIFIVLLAALLLVQLPFVYRRIQTGSVASVIERTTPKPQSDGFASRLREVKGIVHVHTAFSGELSNAFDEMLEAAASNQLDFVLLTEHYSTSFDTSKITLDGVYGSTLFVAGNEIDTGAGDRLLMLPGGAMADDFRLMETAEVLDRIHADGGIALVAYPEKFSSWHLPADGVEVFNVDTVLKNAPFPLALGDLAWSWPAYPALTIARHFYRPSANLAMFDKTSRERRSVLVAGLNAHSAIGFHILGDELGQELMGLKFDAYDTIFRLSRMHVLLDTEKSLDRPSLLQAIKQGRFFTGMDVLGDTTGFRFFASSPTGTLEMGDELAYTTGISLTALAPIAARFVVLKNGEQVQESRETIKATFPIDGPGVYRVEVYRTDLGDDYAKIPWIFSNPIYVR